MTFEDFISCCWIALSYVTWVVMWKEFQHERHKESPNTQYFLVLLGVVIVITPMMLFMTAGLVVVIGRGVFA